METILPFAGGVTAAAWGIVHLLPTRKVVAGLGDTSEDNRNIVRMEWIAEGAFLGAGTGQRISDGDVPPPLADTSGDVASTASLASAWC